MKTDPVLTASWDRDRNGARGQEEAWLVGERMVRRLNEDMYLGSGFEVEWFFLVEGRRGQRAF